LTTEGQTFAFLTYFEKLSRRSQLFAHAREIFTETILLRFNHQQINPFEGFAHGEN